MQDYQAQLKGARRRLDELSTFNFTRVPQAESQAPVWLTTDEGQRSTSALARAEVDEAVAIFAAARERACDDWTNLLWRACWPATKEEAS